MGQFEQILSAIAAAAKIAGGLGLPVAGLVGEMIPVFSGLVESISAHTGKTREEIIAQTGVTLDTELAALLASDAAGQ